MLRSANTTVKIRQYFHAPSLRTSVRTTPKNPRMIIAIATDAVACNLDDMHYTFISSRTISGSVFRYKRACDLNQRSTGIPDISHSLSPRFDLGSDKPN